MAGSGACCVGCKLFKLLSGIGALNWGLVALWKVDLVAKLLGTGRASRIVYILVGIAGLMTLLSFVICCPCKKGGCETKK